MAAATHNEAQPGTTWQQRRYSVAAARHNPTLIFTAGLQRGDSVASTWRQRGTLPKFAFSSPERGYPKRGKTVRPKRDTVIGTYRGCYTHERLVRVTRLKTIRFTCIGEIGYKIVRASGLVRGTRVSDLVYTTNQLNYDLLKIRH